jgi:acylphosphatase
MPNRGIACWAFKCCASGSSELQLNYLPHNNKAGHMVLHAIVKGRVQGVGFRYFVLQKAEALALNGWVRNLPGGHVEVEVVGDEDAIYEMEQALWKGPHFSRVEDVACERIDEPRDYASFEVRR